MIGKCRKYRRMMEQALDAKLDPSARHALDEHLAVCPDCQHLARAWARIGDYDLAWRQHRAGLNAELPDGAQERIMAAIRSDAANWGQPEVIVGTGAKQDHTGWARPWGRLAGVAVAVLLLVVGWRFMMPAQTAAPADSIQTDADMVISAGTTAGTAKSSEKYGTGQDAEGNEAWHAYTGSVATALAPSVTDQFGQTEATAKNGTENSLRTNLCSESLQKVINEAVAARVYTRQSPTPQTLVLLACQAADAERFYDQAKMSLTSCETPFRIEIIRIGDLPARVDGFSAILLTQTVEASLLTNDDLSWVMILIGA
jgi:hypothetical protein